MSDRLKNLLTGAVIIAVFLSIRLVFPHAILLIDFCTLFAILYFSQILGSRLFPAAQLIPATLAGSIGFFSLQSLAQTLWFYADLQLGSMSDTWTMTSAMLCCAAIALIPHSQERPVAHPKESWTLKRTLLAIALSITTIGSVGYVLLNAVRAATSDSINTPWPLLPAGILVAISLAWLNSLLFAWLMNSPVLSSICSGFALAATTAIAPLLYRLGFGFDGFLHVAAEKLILTNGTLTPKPFYYIGQYMFTTWLSRITDLPIAQIDRWLVPIAAACLIPLALFVSRKKNDSPALAFSLFLLPLAGFIATTPQSFAYVLGIAALLLARSTADKTVHPLAPLLLAAWSVAVHPLAGIPIFLLVSAFTLLRPFQSSTVRVLARLFSVASTVGAAFSVPILFFVLSLRGTTAINWDVAKLFTFTPWLSVLSQLIPWTNNSFVVWPGWATLISLALPGILIVANIATIIHKKNEERWQAVLALSTALLLLFAGAALKTAGDFAFLIDYERGNYADRLGIIALFCLLPSALPMLARLMDRARSTQPLLGAATIIACLTIAAAMTYNALPRHDALVTGHGWSVGRADLEAVRTIDRDSNGQAYTVLANQSVSAAAVSQLGFKRYKNDIFFYPIPTGGPLYDTFLRMTYNEPSRDTAQEAAVMGGSNLVYVVINDYWWNAQILNETLTAIADTHWNLGDPNAGPGHAVSVYSFKIAKP